LHREPSPSQHEPRKTGRSCSPDTADTLFGSHTDRSPWPVDRTDDSAKLNVGGGAGQHTAAAKSFPAVDHLGIAQLAQNGIEELLRNIMSFGNFNG